jgi:hypothetical protein
MSTDLVAANAAALEAIQAQQDQEFSDDDFQVPLLKVGQPLTKEVSNEQAEAGEFINTLTGEGIGTEIEFIISYYQQGRFAADRETGRGYSAFGDLIPDHWADLVGEEFVGTRFDEHPDAEETFKENVNNKVHEWGKGPLISTTHNYTGIALVPVIDDETGEETDEVEMQPVRLSLKRTDMPAVRKITQLKRMSLRNQPFWAKVFNLKTDKKTFTKGASFLVVPTLGRITTAEEREAAGELAIHVAAGRVSDNSEKSGGDAQVKPQNDGALPV